VIARAAGTEKARPPPRLRSFEYVLVACHAIPNRLLNFALTPCLPSLVAHLLPSGAMGVSDTKTCGQPIMVSAPMSCLVMCCPIGKATLCSYPGGGFSSQLVCILLVLGQLRACVGVVHGPVVIFGVAGWKRRAYCGAECRRQTMPCLRNPPPNAPLSCATVTRA
jgi:hypothetical protein